MRRGGEIMRAVRQRRHPGRKSVLWELARGKNCGIIALSHSKIFLKEEILLDNEKIPLRSEVPEAET